MTIDEAIKTLKENLCGKCAYGSQCMESCDIRICDNRDAIKTLEQGSSEDCVSRQMVTDAVEKTIAKYIPTFIGKYEKIPLELAIAIRDVPPASPTCKEWIPVSERLPEDSGEYLVSVTDKEDEEYKQVGVAWFAHPKDYDIKDGEWRELMIDEVVIAWMPLPEPYNVESED